MGHLYSHEDYPMAQWMSRCERFLDELLRLEGRGDYRHQRRCAECDVPAAEATWRCRDCLTDVIFCASCLVTIHRDNPLH
ncbi:hypothetical protein K438DRAFT_1613251 [Mycena galopus ATCC 62051]|nr:hypothetical protein K438DRAFT_1613251 [Mycena galopus ATCC 62051]